MAAAALAGPGRGGWRTWWAYAASVRDGRRGKPSRGRGVRVPLVGVVPFVNRTGDASLDWAGEGVARLVADSLALSRHVRVVSPQRAAALRSGTPRTRGHSSRLRARAASRTCVTGEMLTGPDGFTVATRLTDTGAGTDVVSTRVDGASKSDVIGASNEVAAAVSAGLRIPLTEQVDTYNADFATQKTDAYEIYVQGLNAVSAYKYDDAARLFQAVLAEGAGLHDGEVPPRERLRVHGRDRRRPQRRSPPRWPKPRACPTGRPVTSGRSTPTSRRK